MVDIRNNSIYVAVASITLVFGILGWLWPDFLHQIQYPIFIVLVLLIGIPHGATDYLLFQRIHGVKLKKKQVFQFFLYYLVAAFGYLLCWLWLPVFALILFLAISAYHFGQSNWQYLRLSRMIAFMMYIVWGTCVLGGALLWHWDESSAIIGHLIGAELEWTDAEMAKIQWLLLLFCILLIIGLRLIRAVNSWQMLREITSLVLLSFVLFYTPLLVGFTIYFTLWHSLGSLLNQVAFFRRQTPSFTLLHYYRQAAPYTLLSLVGLFLLVLSQSVLSSETSIVSQFFILIACITLPHIFLVEKSYKS
ncbi:MAG: Brp/Blh family beta-carotene 15,15'-dioxygenase [Saprospiraceae bacterium]|nr:Brp/Blh family beta-carotene 15,15'-dioxygenase [Saprospiraceae bacterium]MDZ4703920.1 Brp/Blh family beta-carotene 15,15'-dioxygenase [Saprospiraceae bacterium]